VNTGKIIHSTFLAEHGYPVEFGELKLDGVSGAGSPIRLDFLDPAGCMTGLLLPTGSPTDIITVPYRGVPTSFTVSCVDAANPFVFVSRSDFGLTGEESIAELQTNLTDILMDIRAEAAVKMGLATSPESARRVMGTPKIALIGQPVEYTTAAGRCISSDEMDIWVRPFSMGKPHPAIQMTGAVCLAAAAAVPGTLVNLISTVSQAARAGTKSPPLLIGHASGTMATDSQALVDANGKLEIRRGSVYRTARRLMEGSVLYSKSS
jgi:2-methylaconitate cis-trans-isomerase PrpF